VLTQSLVKHQSTASHADGNQINSLQICRTGLAGILGFRPRATIMHIYIIIKVD